MQLYIVAWDWVLWGLYAFIALCVVIAIVCLIASEIGRTIVTRRTDDELEGGQ